MYYWVDWPVNPLRPDPCSPVPAHKKRNMFDGSTHCAAPCGCSIVPGCHTPLCSISYRYTTRQTVLCKLSYTYRYIGYQHIVPRLTRYRYTLLVYMLHNISRFSLWWHSDVGGRFRWRFVHLKKKRNAHHPLIFQVYTAPKTKNATGRHNNQRKKIRTYITLRVYQVCSININSTFCWYINIGAKTLVQKYRHFVPCRKERRCWRGCRGCSRRGSGCSGLAKWNKPRQHATTEEQEQNDR